MPHRTDPDAPTDWHAQELLLMREVMKLVGRSLAPAYVLREMLHLMSELLGLNRGRIVLADARQHPGPQRRDAGLASAMPMASRAAEMPSAACMRWGEGITGRVLASRPTHAMVQDIDAEPLFLFRVPCHARELPPADGGLPRAADRGRPRRDRRRAGLPPHPQPPCVA